MTDWGDSVHFGASTTVAVLVVLVVGGTWIGVGEVVAQEDSEKNVIARTAPGEKTSNSGQRKYVQN